MLNATDFSIQHQIPFSDDPFSTMKVHEPHAQISKSVAVVGDDSMELPPALLETEAEFSATDMQFLLNAIESFGSDDCKHNTANAANLSCPFNNRFAEESANNRNVPPTDDNGSSICLDDSLKSLKMLDGSSCVEDHSLDECLSKNVQFVNCTKWEDFAMKPITPTSSENELPELDLDGCHSISEESDLEGCISVFEEANDSNKSENSPNSVDQSTVSGSSCCSSTSNKRFFNEASTHRSSIPTPVHSSSKCDISMMNSSSVQEEDHHLYNFPDIKTHQEKNWMNRYEQLRKFYKEEGHCCVPTNNSTCTKYRTLANWVKRQRREYKHMKNGKRSAMTTERVHMLDKINFIWDSHDDVWNERLEALKKFRNEYGNCNVPYRYDKDKRLGTWVKSQRHQYKLYRQGRSSSMNPRRIYLLTNLDFEWVGRGSSLPSSSDKSV